jgi:hypothetical protein
VLATLSPQFVVLYAPVGRPSIAPERLLRALLLQILFTVRSERQKRRLGLEASERSGDKIATKEPAGRPRFLPTGE